LILKPAWFVHIAKNKKNENSFTTGCTSYKHPHHMSSSKSSRNLQFDVQSTESARSMTDESTEIPSYLNIKEIKIELKAGFEAKKIFCKISLF
jgi:hypothetical protein